MTKKQGGDQYSPEETTRRVESALRGARIVGPLHVASSKGRKSKEKKSKRGVTKSA